MKPRHIELRHLNALPCGKEAHMKIALVLGSGGARGYAHIGVIEELQARGHDIVAVSGCSMGALVGGVFAAGALDDYTRFAKELSRKEVLRYADVTLSSSGFLRAGRLMSVLEEMVGDVNIEDLPIPYTAVATDIERRREVWLRSGLLVPAMRASFSIPTIFTPVTIDGRVLVDGGVLNPLPMEPALHEHAELSIGVSLFGRRLGLDPSSPDHGASAGHKEGGRVWPGLTSGMRQLIPSMPAIPGTRGRHALPSTAQDAELEASTAAPSTSRRMLGIPAIEMMSTTLDVMQGQIELGRTAMNRPDILVSVPTDTCEVFDFHEAERVIAVGRRLAVEALDRAGL